MVIQHCLLDRSVISKKFLTNYLHICYSDPLKSLVSVWRAKMLWLVSAVIHQCKVSWQPPLTVIGRLLWYTAQVGVLGNLLRVPTFLYRDLGFNQWHVWNFSFYYKTFFVGSNILLVPFCNLIFFSSFLCSVLSFT